MNIRPNLAFPIAGLALALLPLAHANQTISQTSSDDMDELQFFQPMGQSFTAEGAFLTDFQFYIGPANQNWPVTSLSMEILDGNGLGGSVLDSQTFSPGGGYQWLDWSLKLAVTSGNQYTAVITNSGSPYWGIDGYDGDAYSGGQAYVNNYPQYNTIGDFTFQATFASAAPDAASTLGLLGAGLGVLFLAGSRKRVSS
ncbi:MAG TPA: hypothetical protein VGL42_06875 [Opitutaceae bacterium]|jgi:hypothetical protein